MIRVLALKRRSTYSAVATAIATNPPREKVRTSATRLSPRARSSASRKPRLPESDQVNSASATALAYRRPKSLACIPSGERNSRASLLASWLSDMPECATYTGTSTAMTHIEMITGMSHFSGRADFATAAPASSANTTMSSGFATHSRR